MGAVCGKPVPAQESGPAERLPPPLSETAREDIPAKVAPNADAGTLDHTTTDSTTAGKQLTAEGITNHSGTLSRFEAPITVAVPEAILQAASCKCAFRRWHPLRDDATLLPVQEFLKICKIRMCRPSLNI